MYFFRAYIFICMYGHVMHLVLQLHTWMRPIEERPHHLRTIDVYCVGVKRVIKVIYARYLLIANEHARTCAFFNATIIPPVQITGHRRHLNRFFTYSLWINGYMVFVKCIGKWIIVVMELRIILGKTYYEHMKEYKKKAGLGKWMMEYI